MTRLCRVRSAVSAAALLLLAGVAAPRAAAQQRPAPTGTLPQDPLQIATEVGRFLFAYDQAAARATTMLLSEEVGTDAVEASIARQHEGGGWSVGFGRLADGGRFELMHEVAMDEERLVDEVRSGLGRELPPDSYYARAARAQQLVRAQLGGEHGPYNLLVVPVGASESHLTVYALPAQTKEDVYRLGGDFRYEVDPAAGEIVRQTPLHERYYEVAALPQEAAGSAHEATRPVETDVLFATVRRPKAPHFVMTEEQVYRIAPNGEITATPPGRFDERDDIRVLTGE